MVNFYKFVMADASATTIRLRFLAFPSLNSTTGPDITGRIMTTCLGIIVLIPESKFVKPILNNYGIRTTYYSSTGNYTACSV